MITGKVFIIITVMLLVVIGLNIGIYFSVKRRSKTRSYQVLGKLVKRARNPWEDEKLAELSRQVAKLQAPDKSAQQDETE